MRWATEGCDEQVSVAVRGSELYDALKDHQVPSTMFCA